MLFSKPAKPGQASEIQIGRIEDAIALLNRKIDRLIANVTAIANKENAIMAAIDDLNAKITEVASKVEEVGADLAKEIAALAAALTAAGTPDAVIQASTASLQAVADRLTAIHASMPA